MAFRAPEQLVARSGLYKWLDRRGHGLSSIVMRWSPLIRAVALAGLAAHLAAPNASGQETQPGTTQRQPTLETEAPPAKPLPSLLPPVASYPIEPLPLLPPHMQATPIVHAIAR